MRDWEILDPRRAGELQRYHTWPCLRTQTAADHQWNVARLVLAIWPQAPREIIIHALLHDVGEVAVGDPPFPVKRNNEQLKATLDAMERSAHLAMCAAWSLPPPLKIGYGLHVVKIADILDMWEYALSEIASGNMRHRLVERRTRVVLADLLAQTGLPCGVTARTCRYILNRMKVHERTLHG